VELDLQAKLLAYKAYTLGREAVSRGSEAEETYLARAWLRDLENHSPSEQTLRRRLFYTLILAEIHRVSDPVPFRQSAMELGERLESMGALNPVPLFMYIIRATTGSLGTGNLGDFTTQAVEPIQDSWSSTDEFGNLITIDAAQSALGLSDRDLEEFRWFLRKPLREVARLHGLVR
jgi:hypothetical protein